MTDPRPPLRGDVIARHRQRVERFVVRARRIADHSLLSDRALLHSWASGHVTVDRASGVMRWDLPPEEAFESLAARTRPLLLNDDGIRMDSVLGSLKAFVRGDETRTNQIKSLRAEWDEVRAPESPVTLARVVTASRAPTATYDQVAAAEAWLYGDLVHASELASDMAPIQMRYPLAVLVFGRAAMLAVATLELVRCWDADGLLSLNPDVWAQRVRAEVPYVMRAEVSRLTMGEW